MKELSDRAAERQREAERKQKATGEGTANAIRAARHLERTTKQYLKDRNSHAGVQVDIRDSTTAQLSLGPRRLTIAVSFNDGGCVYYLDDGGDVDIQLTNEDEALDAILDWLKEVGAD